MLPVAPPDRGRGREANSDALVDIGAFSSTAPDDILGGQYPLPCAATLTRRFMQLWVLNVCLLQAWTFSRVIPEIDIWRAATLMLKRYGEKALEQSATRADELAADGDPDGADTWRRITAAVEQLANTVPQGPLH